LRSAPFGGYDITVNDTLPGSWTLQACFYVLAIAIIATAAWLVYRASLTSGDSEAASRRRLRGFLWRACAWVVVISAVSLAGGFNPAQRPPVMFVAMLAAILALGVAIARSESGRILARGLPLAVLVGFQGFRFPLELAMHRAYTEGLMPIQMSYSGRNFDIVTGLTAIVLGAALAATNVPAWVVQAWNLLGLGLLINILAVAMLSTPVFAYFGPDRLNVFVMRMPYTLLPAVMVLAAWAGHLIVFRALKERAGRAG
jgi:hypothetical protein